jgi:uncharacterized membrane protein YgcG
MRSGGLIFTAYVVVGVLVAAGVIGDEGDYFSGMNSIEEIAEMLLAVFPWPLVLLDVNMNIGGNGGNGAESGGAGGGGAGGGGGGAGGGGK